MNALEALAFTHPLVRSWERPRPQDWAEVLATFPVFSGVSIRRLRKLVRTATFAELAAGDLIHAGAAESLHVILGGSAKPLGEPGARALGIGDHFGGPAVDDGPPSSTTVVATRELHVMKLSRKSVEPISALMPSRGVSASDPRRAGSAGRGAAAFPAVKRATPRSDGHA